MVQTHNWNLRVSQFNYWKPNWWHLTNPDKKWWSSVFRNEMIVWGNDLWVDHHLHRLFNIISRIRVVTSLALLLCSSCCEMIEVTLKNPLQKMLLFAAGEVENVNRISIASLNLLYLMQCELMCRCWKNRHREERKSGYIIKKEEKWRAQKEEKKIESPMKVELNRRGFECISRFSKSEFGDSGRSLCTGTFRHFFLFLRCLLSRSREDDTRKRIFDVKLRRISFSSDGW